jgi:hypothetical protein
MGPILALHTCEFGAVLDVAGNVVPSRTFLLHFTDNIGCEHITSLQEMNQNGYWNHEINDLPPCYY